MELLYVWIEEYKNLKNFGFNFGGEYLFEFDNENDEGLTYKKNDKYIPDFFGKNISNITGLVGKNGAGKSIILEYLFQRLPKSRFQKSYKSIVVYKDSSQINIYIGKNYGHLINPKTLNKFKITNNFPKEIFPIFYSNNIYERITDVSGYGAYNASYKAFLLNNIGFSDNSFPVPPSTYFFRHEVTEVIQKIKLLKDCKSDLFKHRIPSHIWILADRTTERNLKNDKNEETREKIKNIIDAISTIEASKLEVYKLRVFLQLLLNSWLNRSLISADDIINQLKTIKSYEGVKEMLINLYENSRHETDDSNHQKLIKFINEFDKLIDNSDEFYNNKGLLFVRFDLNIPENKTRINDILEMYQDTLYLKNTKFLNFGFGNNEEIYGQSSGENAFLSLYSRIYDAKEELIRSKPKTIILLLDEPDLYLHPQWQKELIYNLSNNLQLIFPNKEIQIVITSHSPIVISDLPKNNVVYLNDGKNVTKERKGGTFGKNIHDLYKDAFFMEGGTMGKFAEDKINNLIEDIKSLRDNDDKKGLERETGTIKKRITIIDEHIYRFKLEDMYNEIMLSGEENLNALYETKLAQLKKRFGKDDTDS